MTTFTKQISSTADDGTDLDGSSFDSSFLAAGTDSFFGTVEIGALRFSGVTIPNGSTITSATLTILSAGADDGTVSSVTIYGVAEDNCAAFTNLNLPSAKARTSATTSLSHGGTNGTTYTPNVTTIAQEVLGRGGWASGNALSLVLVAAGGGAAAYQDFSSLGATPATLSITYSGAGASTYNETIAETVTAAATVTATIASNSLTEVVNAATSFAATVTCRASLTEAGTAATSLAVQFTGWTYGSPVTATWNLNSAAASIWTPIASTSTNWT